MTPFRNSICRKHPVGRSQTVLLTPRRNNGDCPGGGRAAGPLIASVGMLLGAVLVCGCQSLSPDSESGMFNASRLLDISRIRGPLERTFPGDESPLELGKKYSPEAKRQVDLAQAKFDSGEYKAAARMFKAAAKKYKDSSIGEEAQYRLGECWYALGEYPKAQDAFDLR